MSLLLNLNIDEGENVASIAPKAGGRWKDRLKAKKAQRKRLNGPKPKGVSEPQKIKKDSGTSDHKRRQSGLSDGREDHKKVRLDTSRPKSEPRRLQRNSDISGVAQQSAFASSTRDGDTFVSSLFTSNDQPVHETNTEPENLTPSLPSNAPVSDSQTFSGLGVNPLLCNRLTKQNLTHPTAIQRLTVPKIIHNNTDIFVRAQTGSGKTLSYVLPVLTRMLKVPGISRESGLYAIILAPTRELANQIYSVLDDFCHTVHWLVPGIVIGGERKKSEKARIRKGINILVATPGRLLDHFDNTKSLDLSQVRWLILDEGDRLMELGFEETIKGIIQHLDNSSKSSGANGNSNKIALGSGRFEQKSDFAITASNSSLPSKRINILCSATMKEEVERLAELTGVHVDKDAYEAHELDEVEEKLPRNLTGNDAADKTDSESSQSLAPAQLVQEYVVVSAKLRLVTLASIIVEVTKKDPNAKVMVFCSCSDVVDFYYSVFAKRPSESKEPDGTEEESKKSQSSNSLDTVSLSPFLNTFVYKLHGSLNQNARKATLSAFSSSKATETGTGGVLFCTDVASRGLDLTISYIIEYDPPFSIEDHIHRVGRTARAGNKGSSVLFLLPGKEEGYLEVIGPCHPNGLRSKRYEECLKAGFGSKWEIEATTWHLNIERWLLEDSVALNRARRAFTSHVRAYATHLAAERSIFDMKSLHLGHIAKSFGLRETPGGHGKAGGKVGGKAGGKTGSRTGRKGDGKTEGSGPDYSDHSSKNLMWKVARQTLAASANEFNIG